MEKDNLTYLDMLQRPMVRHRLRAIEGALVSGQGEARRLRSMLGDINMTYLQRLIRCLNVYYETTDSAIGERNCITRRQNGTAAASNPIYRLRYIDRNLMFPEVLLDDDHREVLSKVLYVAAMFDSVAPITKILRASGVRADIVTSNGNSGSEIYTLLATIYEALRAGRRLSIDYPGLGENLDVHPYMLRQFNTKWYLLGRIRRSPYHWTIFTLNRIRHIGLKEEESTPLTPQQQMELNAYYSNVIGFDVPTPADTDVDMFRPEVHHITATITPGVKRYLAENPIHHSQKILTDAAGHLTMTLDVIENASLYKALLSYGSDIEVTAPATIRARMGELTNNMHNIYR